MSRRPVVTDLFDEKEGWQPGHIELADEADLLLIAPATAHIVAQLALGLAPDALTSLALATLAPILVAPAMNGKMWLHPATQGHVATLTARGVRFVGPEEGMLACGYEGVGRLWPVQGITDAVEELIRETWARKTC
jgi:phosphopantothenoylcysteine synthetase/decarboxylase